MGFNVNCYTNLIKKAQSLPQGYTSSQIFPKKNHTALWAASLQYNHISILYCILNDGKTGPGA